MFVFIYVQFYTFIHLVFFKLFLFVLESTKYFKAIEIPFNSKQRFQVWKMKWNLTKENETLEKCFIGQSNGKKSMHT